MSSDIPFSRKNFILQGEGRFSTNYTKIKEIGSGAFAKVYLVKNKGTNEVYACKELTKSKIKNLDMLKDEINIMSKVDHPNIIKLLEVYENTLSIELIMEQCQGGCVFDNLVKKIKSEGKAYSEREAASIFKQIMLAINYCHDQGICHRDLKLENVLFLTTQKNSPVKLIDFGLSNYFRRQKLSHNLKKSNNGQVKMKKKVGSPHYISPEVLEGKYTQKCDIWSAGVMLYVMLVGYFPFDGNTDQETLNAIKKKKFSFDDKQWDNISNDAKDLIKHMLCDEDKRYSSEKVLNHPWILKASPNPSGAVNKINVKHLFDYQDFCNFKKFVLTYIATRLREKDLKDLEQIFLEIDEDKDGTLSFDEVKKCFIRLINDKKLKINIHNIDTLFKSIDTNNSKKIDYTEFIAAMIDASPYCKEDRLVDIFKFLDKDGSGKISRNEIKNVLDTEKIRDKDMNYFINSFDLNGDGQIDYREYIDCMTKKDKELKNIDTLKDI